jgi:hypothetical protein
MLEEIGRLNGELKALRGAMDVREFELHEMQCRGESQGEQITVHRVPGLERVKIIYESDPNKDERIRQLSEELELAIVLLSFKCSWTGRTQG